MGDKKLVGADYLVWFRTLINWQFTTKYFCVELCYKLTTEMIVDLC